MTLRVTGLASGLDTESIISELVSVNSYKVASLQKEQTKLSWKTDAWKSMNSKVYSFYTSTLSDLRFSSSYSTRKTTVSDSNVATVKTGSGASNTTQTMRVDQMAKAGYLTGGKLGGGVTANTKLSELDSNIGAGQIKLTIGKGTPIAIDITADTTVKDIVDKLKEQGLNASFDEKNQRMFISSAETGENYDFTLESEDENGKKALAALKINMTEPNTEAKKIPGQNAIIYLNDAEFTSDTNTFEINGLTITCNAETGDSPITLTTQDDTSGVYDMIKDFIKEYTGLINEMDKLYNADRAKGYEPLTDEEKDAMSESEIEKWETKIKDSLLKGDSTLSTVSSAMKEIMSSGFEVGGKTMYLSDFGIETMGYFEAEDNQRNAYYINGDKDNENSTIKNKSNDLMAAISKDPTQVRDFFNQLAQSLKTKLDDLMGGTDYATTYSVYEDKKMKTEYDEYTKKIKEAEQKLADYEDKWYKKFAAMETAMAKMQSNMNAVSSMFGGMQ